MSKKDLIAYAAWFHDTTPARITELTGGDEHPGYERWEPNATPESLEDLGQWFEGQVETRKKKAEEIAEARAKLTFPIDIPDEQLTNRTFSWAMDVGMYFAQVVLKNLPGTRWDQPLRSKRFADYGQPVLMGFGTVPPESGARGGDERLQGGQQEASRPPKALRHLGADEAVNVIAPRPRPTRSPPQRRGGHATSTRQLGIESSRARPAM